MTSIKWEVTSVGDDRTEKRDVWDVPYRTSVSESSLVDHVALTEVVLRSLKRRFEMIGAVVSPVWTGVGVGVGVGPVPTVRMKEVDLEIEPEVAATVMV